MDNKENIRVLILDDDKFMLEFVSQMLRELAISEVFLAEDGKAGLRVLSSQTESIDLLICDIEMPGMDGIEFLRNIANQKYSGKIVLFSGIEIDLLKATERLAIAHGLNIIGTLAKPVTLDSLAAVLEKLPLPIHKASDYSTQIRTVRTKQDIIKNKNKKSNPKTNSKNK